jgi:hypothetical protein
MDENQIQEAIVGHQARNVSLKQLLVEKGVDLKEPRPIDCHFYAKSQRDAEALAKALQTRGFKVLVNRQSAGRESHLWNIEAEVVQSVDLTTRREFIDELVRLANANNSEHDGWGTSV